MRYHPSKSNVCGVFTILTIYATSYDRARTFGNVDVKGFYLCGHGPFALES